MKIKNLVAALAVAAGIISGIQACPVTIKNDGKRSIFLVNKHSGEAVYIRSGNTDVIDLGYKNGWFTKLLKKEEICIFVETDKRGSYAKGYCMVENYCVEDSEANKLTFTQIQGFVDNPIDRFTVEKKSCVNPVSNDEKLAGEMVVTK